MTKVPQFEALEPRILLSATPMPETTDTEAVNVDFENQVTESEKLVNEIIFIDSKVEEADKLIESLNRNLEVYYLNEEESGLEQINQILQDREGISAIHILSHGDSGLLRLGNSDINFDDLSASQESSLISFKSVLSESADILIYGCDFGAGEKGLSSLQKLSSLTGADVAASNDDTGAEKLGGDWTLEVKHGEIESQSLSDTSNWQHLLALPAPGGVDANLLFWAKADNGGTAWTDQSGNGVTITTNGTVNTGSFLNFNPTNAFDGTGHYETNLSINAGTHPDLAVISVYVPDVDNAGSPWGEDNGGWDRFILDSDFAGITNSMVSTGTESLTDINNFFVANQANISTVVFDEDVADGSSVQVNGLQETSFTSNHGPETSNVLEIGALGVNNYRFDGRIAETIVYNQLLSSADDLKQIESYLAIKYGITLDSSLGSYLDSNGAAVYTFDGTYENDVTGIGKDNNSSLEQRISKSVNSGSILTISTDTDFTSANSSHTDSLLDGQYLIAANNGGDTSLNASEQLKRQWRVENTGSVGAVNLKFDGFDSTYALVTNTDNDFSTPNTLVGYLNTSGEISGVALADNTYFTLVKSTAVADTDSATEASGLANGTAGTNATGNVLTNDIHSNGTISQAKENTEGTNAAVTPGTDSSDGLAVTGLYGTLTIGADGSYSYVIDNDNATVEALTSAGSINDVFEYTFTDDTGETETALLTVTINGANDAPTVNTTSNDTGTEDVNITYSFTDLLTLIGAADVDNANTDLTVKITSISNASADRTEISTGESVTFTPVADFNGNFTFNYSVDDGETASSTSNTGAATISLVAVVDITDDSVSTAEDTPIVIDVLANDSFEGTPALSIATHPANGTVVVNGDKTITYTPNLNYNGSDSFTYTVTSGGVIETATVNLTVSPVADTPSLSVSSITVKQNNGPTPINISATVGAPGETLSVIVNNLPAGTALSAGTQLGSISWRLSADQFAGLLITFPAEVHGAFSLKVTAISKDGASLASVTSPLSVNIIPFVTPEVSPPIIPSNDQAAQNLITEQKPLGSVISFNEGNNLKERSLIFFEESSIHFNLELLSDDALNVITDIFFEFDAIDPEKIGNQEVAFDGTTRGEGIQDMKVYDISLLNPEESKFLYELLFGESDEDEDELKDESSFFIEDAILEEKVPEKIELAVSQSYLDERVCLSDTLIGEFDCFEV